MDSGKHPYSLLTKVVTISISCHDVHLIDLNPLGLDLLHLLLPVGLPVQLCQPCHILLMNHPLGFLKHTGILLVQSDFHSPIFASKRLTILFDRSSGRNLKKPRNHHAAHP